MSIHLVILGPQGSGKGTQAQLLSKRFKMPYLSAGELIRKKASQKTAEGKKVKALHNSGILIPHKLTKELFEAELRKVPQSQTVIFEGYPRTLEQIEDFEDILAKREKKEKRIIILNIKEKTVYQRLAKRRYCPRCETIFYPKKSLELKNCPKCKTKLIKRPDDRQTIIKNRLDIYKRETEPVSAHYKKTHELIEINGEPSIDEVNKEILEKTRGTIID